ncbi:hypothetical protein BDV93DRAFT_515081 [Ceratobasidium sp. AG-I]|nr:hypothetical protein BDV93DRAFT_515081 [Ceratobasidium sp. AG-I]
MIRHILGNRHGKNLIFRFRNDMRIYRAISGKELPKRPKELAESDNRAHEMWEVLLRCWGHNPAVQPDTYFLLSYFRDLEARAGISERISAYLITYLRGSNRKHEAKERFRAFSVFKHAIRGSDVANKRRGHRGVGD